MECNSGLCLVEEGGHAVGGCIVLACFFFFQAEDGIRDVAVTGVQTCALPISPHRPRARRTRGRCGGRSVTGASFMVGSAMRLALVSLVLLLATGVAANPDDDASAPGQPAAVTAESHFNQGQALARQSDWAGAEQAYREATRVRPAIPEAWNGLGHALRKRGKFEESVKAYQEALRLRPQYPQALE